MKQNLKRKGTIMFADIIKVLILSLGEGLTEFVPVSSTGHMILADQFLKLSENKCVFLCL